MSRSESEFGGSFSVDGTAVEVDLAEFGWPGDRAASHDTEGAGSDAPHEDDGRIRLQKALAHAGIASRRACEALITSGRVTVNGEPERELGSRIDPTTDEVRVDGVVVQLDATKRYFVLNKPLGVVSTMNDENGRPDLREFTQQVEDRLYNVGRLDTDTSGLLILTNDGDLAHKLAHPSFGVQKTYIAKVRGRVTASVIQQLKDGIELSDGPIRADWAKILPGGSGKTHSLVEITIHSGRNRIVRRMLAEVGHPVVELVRRKFGPLRLGTLAMGEMRELGSAERGALLSATSFEEGGDDSTGERGARRPITSGRPGDGKGAQGMRGIAAKGNPHGRRSAEYQGDNRSGGPRSGGPREERGGRYDRDDRSGRDERGGRFDRNDRSGRDDRGGRFERQDRDDRGTRGDRFSRDDRPARDERPARDRRSDEGRGGRGDATAGGRYARSSDSRSRGGRDGAREGGFDRSRGERDGGSRDAGREGGYDRSRGGRDGGYRGDRDSGRDSGYRGNRDGGARDSGSRGNRGAGYRGGREGGFDRSGGSRDGGFRGTRDAGSRGTRDGGFDRSRDDRSGGSRDGGFRGNRDDSPRGPREGGSDRGRPSDSRGGREGGSGRSRDERGGEARGGFRGNRDGGSDRSRGERGDSRGGRDFGGPRGPRDEGQRGDRDRGPRGGGRDGGSRGPKDGQQKRGEW